ncbi:MAG: PAS domain S-box protein [Nitrospirae bacterium]|nr:PAS domain S-box protein [Nitrospirota bacterium]
MTNLGSSVQPDSKIPESRMALERQLRWMIGIRLVVITSVVLPYFLLQLTSAEESPEFSFLYLLAGLTYGASLGYIVLLKLLKGRWRAQALIQFVGDLLLITGMVYYFGGVASPFSILYFIVIIVASALFQRATGFAVASLASFLYAATVAALYFGWIPPSVTLHRGLPSVAYDVSAATQDQVGRAAGLPAWRLIYNLITHIFGFFTVAYLTTRLAQNISRAERELREKQLDLADLQVVHRDIVESVPSGLVTCDLEGMVTSVNLAAQDILGKDRDTLLGKSVSATRLFTEEEWTEIKNQTSPNRRLRPEVIYQRGDSERHIGYSVTLLTDAEGTRTGFILIFQDLSEWRKLQDELQLRERLAAVGELASGIAHEVGNPLAAISGSVQMLTSALEDDSAHRKLLDIIFKESQRLDRTIKSFLQFARPKERSSVRFDIARLLNENVQLLINSPEVSPQHHLELVVDPPSVTLIADPDQISQIFWNLARNSLRAMPGGGTLKVEGRVEDKEYCIRFTDDGRGMSVEERGKMFHPFRSFFDGGSGIGMAIVYRIVEEHGGRLAVDSQPGQGTVITVALPLAPGEPTGMTEEA